MGAAAFALFLKNLPFKIHMIIACFIHLLESLGNLSFISGFYFGMPPVVFYAIVMFLGDSFIMSFV